MPVETPEQVDSFLKRNSWITLLIYGGTIGVLGTIFFLNERMDVLREKNELLKDQIALKDSVVDVALSRVDNIAGKQNSPTNSAATSSGGDSDKVSKLLDGFDAIKKQIEDQAHSTAQVSNLVAGIAGENILLRDKLFEVRDTLVATINELAKQNSIDPDQEVDIIRSIDRVIPSRPVRTTAEFSDVSVSRGEREWISSALTRILTNGSLDVDQLVANRRKAEAEERERVEAISRPGNWKNSMVSIPVYRAILREFRSLSEGLATHYSSGNITISIPPFPDIVEYGQATNYTAIVRFHKDLDLTVTIELPTSMAASMTITMRGHFITSPTAGYGHLKVYADSETITYDSSSIPGFSVEKAKYTNQEEMIERARSLVETILSHHVYVAQLLGKL